MHHHAHQREDVKRTQSQQSNKNDNVQNTNIKIRPFQSHVHEEKQSPELSAHEHFIDFQNHFVQRLNGPMEMRASKNGPLRTHGKHAVYMRNATRTGTPHTGTF